MVVNNIFDDCDDSSREMVDDNNTAADVGSDMVDSIPEVTDVGSRVHINVKLYFQIKLYMNICYH